MIGLCDKAFTFIRVFCMQFLYFSEVAGGTHLFCGHHFLHKSVLISLYFDYHFNTAVRLKKAIGR